MDSNIAPDDIFVYRNLPGRSWTRILTLKPAALPDPDGNAVPIECSLDVVKIADTAKMEFEVLSCLWNHADLVGGPSVRCNDKILHVGVNIKNALEQLRHQTRPTYFWIDALCINQTNKVELSRQIAGMDEVHAMSKRMLMWVGGDVTDEDANDCVELIKSSNEVLINGIKRYKRMSSIPPIIAGEENDTETKDEAEEDGCFSFPFSNKSRWRKVHKLMRARYFYRVWMQQELCLSPEAVIRYGKSILNWKDFDLAIRAIISRKDLQQITGLDENDLFSIIWIGFRKHYEETPQKFTETMTDFQFVQLLLFARNCHATDARDYVFAFLCHPYAKDLHRFKTHTISDREKVFDYTQDVADVFKDAAKTILVSEKVPWTILSCVDHPLLSPTILRSRPSWVPYWSEGSRVDCLGVPGSWYCAGGAGETFRAKRVPNDRLQLRGIQFGTIRWCSQVFELRDIDIRSMPKQTGLTPIENALEQLAAFENHSRSDLGRSNAHNIENSFSLVMVAGRGSKPSIRAAMEMYTHRKLYRAYMKDLIRAAAVTGGTNSGENTCLVSEDALAFQGKLRHLQNRRIFMTDTGYIGLGHGLVEPEDICVVFRGADLPFVLRPLDTDRGPPQFKLVGECYVNAAMRGEVLRDLDQGKLQEKKMILA